MDENKIFQITSKPDSSEQPPELSGEELSEKKQYRIYEQLEKKLLSVSQLIDIVESTTLDQPQEELVEKLDAWYGRVEASTNLEVVKQTNDLDLMHEERNVARRKLKELSAVKPHDNDEMDSWIREQQMVDTENTINWYNKYIAIKEADPDPEVAALFFMRQLAVSLKEKHKIAQKWATDESFKNSEFERIVGAPYDPDHVEELRIDAFGVTAIVDRHYEYSLQATGDMGGHIPGTLFSYAFSDFSEREEVIRHEGLHNIYDAWLRTNDRPADEVVEWIDSLPGTEHGTSVEMILAEINEIRPRDIVDASHEEIIAHLLGTELKDFADVGFDEGEKVEGNFPKNIDGERTLNLATAGHDVATAMAAIDEQMSHENDSGILAAYSKLKQGTHKMIVDSMRVAIDVLRAAKLAGKEVDRDAHALIHVLKPSQYKIMPRYLVGKYGPQFTLSKNGV